MLTTLYNIEMPSKVAKHNIETEKLKKKFAVMTRCLFLLFQKMFVIRGWSIRNVNLFQDYEGIHRKSS